VKNVHHKKIETSKTRLYDKETLKTLNTRSVQNYFGPIIEKLLIKQYRT